MNLIAEISKWVNKKPIILMKFDEDFSDALQESRQGFEHLTITKPHSVVSDLKTPTICILETEDINGPSCYLGTVTKKVAVSTFDSRLTIKKLRKITPSSLEGIGEVITKPQMKNLFNARIPETAAISILSPKLSGYLIERINEASQNKYALETALSLFPNLRKISNQVWEQEDAIKSAIAAFGIHGNAIPDEVILKPDSSSGLSLIGAHLYEDNVVQSDASNIPGFDAIAQDVTGRAIFNKGDERLVIYTANKLPLEKMLGVDLIYINETRGNIVMIQYKMLEQKEKGLNSDWYFRPDNQLNDEISRMKLPCLIEPQTGYRLSRDPFFFKFVKRKIIDSSHQSFLISLEHLNKILNDPASKGARGGISLSYEKLEGTYLREPDMISLIRSGYIGTYREETQVLATIIHEVAKGNKAVVLAWQQKKKN
ncbi:hypothetical protein [Aeromonas hydrophila]|uniref:hypothetical protein n=1 Tax=Aeromonas hydrophila TaxID=644 RepID=UPI00405588FA